ncbi:hypothetical protein BKA69DRAFT_1120980 [Paraphysoderma sedebokerense]|nr:hypothetical protein BKA69DRAFT_1120980 [Paraphysoderma sedebokerense]
MLNIYIHGFPSQTIAVTSNSHILNMFGPKSFIFFVAIAILALCVADSKSSPEPRRSKSRNRMVKGADNKCIAPEEQPVVEPGSSCMPLPAYIKCSGGNSVARCKNFKWEIERCGESNVCYDKMGRLPECMPRNDMKCF